MTVAATRLQAWLPLLPALLVCATWLPALQASFQFDDFAVIVDEPRVQTLAAWWQSMPGIRPLLKLSYALGHEAGAGVAGFRAVNILLHALNASLVFVFARRMARRLRVADAAGALQVAAITVLVFALHPAQTESVTYVSGRSNLLMASFVLLALTAFTQRPGVPGLRQQLLTLAGFALAVASKETALVLPLALWLVLAPDRGLRWPQRLRAMLPACGLALLLAAACIGLPTYRHLLSFSLALRDPLWNLLSQARGIGWLAGQLLGFEALDADPQLAPVTRLDPDVVLAAIALPALLALGCCSLRRLPGLAFGILWCFLWLAPTNSLLARLDLANDRQLYLPLVGAGWLLGLALVRVPGRLRLLVPAQDTLVLAVLGTVLAMATVVRNGVYATEVRFWQDVVAKSPQNGRAQNNLGLAYALACEPLAARGAFERAAALASGDPLPRVNLALLERGELPGQPARAGCR